MLRGGSWDYFPRVIRSAYRFRYDTGLRNRLLRVPCCQDAGLILVSLSLYFLGVWGLCPQRKLSWPVDVKCVYWQRCDVTEARRTGPALETMYQFLLWLVPAVEKFPRRQKFLLGDRIQTTALDVLERLIEATYTRTRRDTLAEANLGIEKLRVLFRLAKDLHHVNMARYEHAARSLDEIGRLIGGWRKANDAAQA